MDEAESRQSGKDNAVQSDRNDVHPYERGLQYPYVETAAHVYWPLVLFVARAVTAETDTNAKGAVSHGVLVSQVAVTPQAEGRFDEMAVEDDTINNDTVMEDSEAADRHAARVLPREGRQCPSIWEDRETRPAKEVDMAEAIEDPTTAMADDARPAEAKAVVAVPDTAATEAGVGAEVRASHAVDIALVVPETPAEATGPTPLQKACVVDASQLPLHLRVRVARMEVKAKELVKEQERDRTVNTVSTLPLEIVAMVISAASATISTPRRLETRSSRRSTNAESNAKPTRAQLPWQGYWL